jgi:hypothetical protein
MRRLFIICLLALSATAMVVSVPAAPAAKKKVAKPSITRVMPMRISVGARLTILGKNFKATAKENTVVFRAPNGRSAFAKPRRASHGKLVVVVPGAVSRLLGGSQSNPKPTRLKLRVLAGKFSAFTTRRLSPVVTGFGSGDGPGGGGPGPGGSGPGSSGSGGSGGSGGGGGTADVSCTSSADHDGDMLANTLESDIKTDPCKADTDGDGVQDGYEYKSAVDLNNDEYQEPNESVPYPGKRPYPNPLDPSDAGTDYDGDTLNLTDEQSLWLISSTPATRTIDTPLSYSDGLQHSIYEHRAGQGDRRFPDLEAAGYVKQADFTNWAAGAGYLTSVHVPDPGNPGDYLARHLFDFDLNPGTPNETLHYDLDLSGFLSDQERDEDADGMINFDENTGRTQAGWWTSCYDFEAPYYITYSDTDIADPDTDGDGVRDGADDQDHDDFPNVMELSRIAASGHDDTEAGQQCVLAEAIEDMFENVDPPHYRHQNDYGRVNPFNPCLPVTHSRTCNRFPSFEQKWAPFDQSPNWYALN